MAAEATAERRTLSRVMKPRRTVPSKDMDWKTERSKVPELRPMGIPPKKTSVDLLAKEEEYIRLNAELEAKTADLVRQAEQVMREQNEVLSKPLSSFLITATEDENEDTRPQQHAVQPAGTKVVRNKRLTSTPVSNDTHSGYERKAQHVSNKTATLKSVGTDDGDIRPTADIDDSIQSMEEKLNEVEGDTIASDAQIRVLKARLHIMHEEFNQLSHECHRKDEENFKLGTKIKELEGDRARLQKNSNIQQTQIEKHRALAEDSSRRCDALQMQVTALQKEIEALNKSQKQAAGSQSTVEVRLNRALEDIERYKTQLNNMKLKNKDQEHQESLNKENLLAENKMLKKQKAELILGFKKQLKLIDILKRQKMHFETAKMLSFTEEEFMKALDWGSKS